MADADNFDPSIEGFLEVEPIGRHGAPLDTISEVSSQGPVHQADLSPSILQTNLPPTRSSHDQDIELHPIASTSTHPGLGSSIKSAASTSIKPDSLEITQIPATTDIELGHTRIIPHETLTDPNDPTTSITTRCHRPLGFLPPRNLRGARLLGWHINALCYPICSFACIAQVSHASLRWSVFPF